MKTLLLVLMSAVTVVQAQEGHPRFPRGGERGGDRGGQRELPRREIPRREEPRRELPRRELPRREEPRRELPRREIPRREIPRREEPRREIPRREEPRREEPRREIPRREEPRREIPRRENPRREDPRREERRREERRRRTPGDGRARPTPPQQRPPVVVDPGPSRPGRRLPRPALPGGNLDGRREHDRDVRFPSQPGHHHHQDRWGRRLPPSRDHITVINNTTIVNNIRVYERDWDRHTHHGYEYHYWNGHRIGHHYDRHRRHWWGFYIGSVYFWTRYHHDHYWWYDPYYHRWVYLHEGRWWYRDPVNVTVVYVYDDGRYYRYADARGGVVLLPDPTPPAEPIPTDPAAPTAPEADKEVYVSEDGTRQVRIIGGERDAFLYDLSETPSFEPEYLASDVKEVVFNTPDEGELQIMLVVEKTVNGQVERSFRVFDASGDDLLAPATPDEQSLREGSESFQQLESGSATIPQ